MRNHGKLIWIAGLTLILTLASQPIYAKNWSLGLYGSLGASNIDYPGHGKNPDYTFAYEIGSVVEKKISNLINLGTGIRFQKSGYLQKNGFYTDNLNPIDVGINDYRMTLPIELYLYPKKDFPISLMIGIENSFTITRNKIIKPKEPNYQIEIGKPNIYNVNFEIGIRGDFIKSLSVGVLYKRGLNAVHRHVEGFNLNMIAMTVSWRFYKF